MKICMLMSTNFPPEEGIGYYVYNLSKKLLEKGHEVTIITRGSYTNEISYFEGIKVNETIIPTILSISCPSS